MTNMDDSTSNLNILDKLGGFLLFICAISLLGVFVCLFCCKPVKVQPFQISLTIQTDSTGVIDSASRQAIDSLTTIVRQQDIYVRERYSLLMNQREYENGLITFSGIIVSIILGVFGFFGYKSFKSIEDKAVTNAKDKVNKEINTGMVSMQKTLERELTGTIDKRFIKEYQERLGVEVANKLNENYNESISAKLNYIKENGKAFEDMQKRVSQIELFVSQLQDQGIVVKFPVLERENDDLKEFAEQRTQNKEGGKPTKDKGDE